MTERPKYIREMPSFKDWEWGPADESFDYAQELEEAVNKIEQDFAKRWNSAAQESFRLLVEGMFDDARIITQEDGTLLLVTFDETLQVRFTESGTDGMFMTWTPKSPKYPKVDLA